MGFRQVAQGFGLPQRGLGVAALQPEGGGGLSGEGRPAAGAGGRAEARQQPASRGRFIDDVAQRRPNPEDEGLPGGGLPATTAGVAAGVDQRGGAVAEAAHAGGPFLGREVAVAEVAQDPVQGGVVREQGLGGREAVGADVVLQGGLDLDQEGGRGPVQRDGQPVERLHGAEGVVGPPVGEEGDAGEGPSRGPAPRGRSRR